MTGVAPVEARAASTDAFTGVLQGWYTWTRPSGRPMVPSKLPIWASSSRTSFWACTSASCGLTKAPR